MKDTRTRANCRRCGDNIRREGKEWVHYYPILDKDHKAEPWPQGEIKAGMIANIENVENALAFLPHGEPIPMDIGDGVILEAK